MKRIISILVVVLIVSTTGVVAQEANATNTTSTPGDKQTTTTAANSSTGGENLTKSDVLDIIQNDPYEASSERIDEVKEWLLRGNEESLNGVESEDVATWLRKAEEGPPPVAKENRTYLDRVTNNSRVFDYQFNEQGTLTVWVESDISESYYMWDASVYSCAGKGLSHVPEGAEKGGELTRGDNKLTLSVDMCNGRYQAGFRIDGETVIISSDDPKQGSGLPTGTGDYLAILIGLLSPFVVLYAIHRYLSGKEEEEPEVVA